jgi:hypothetical protein
MFKLKFEEYEELVRRLESFVGKRLLISESITRDREIGHERHFATMTHFEMELESVFTALSGAQLMLNGKGRHKLGVSAESIVRTSLGGGVVEIIEWFESETERKTTISVLE